MHKLDNKDRKLLFELSKNARSSHTQLGKAIGLSKSSIGHRIQRLKKDRIIERFTTAINFGALTTHTSIILLRFNEHIDTEIQAYFRNEAHSTWVVHLSGQWDILAEIAFDSMRTQEETIQKILNDFSGKLNSIELLYQVKAIRVEHLVKDFYSEPTSAIQNSNTQQDLPLKMPRLQSPAPIDHTDRRILKALSTDSEISILELARKTGKNIDTLRERMKQLTANNIIIKFFIEINLHNLGYTEIIYKIKLNNINREKIGALANEIRRNNNVKYACSDITGTDIIIHFAFKDVNCMDEFSSDIRRRYHSIIAQQEYYLVKEQLKFDLFPESLVLSENSENK